MLRKLTALFLLVLLPFLFYGAILAQETPQEIAHNASSNTETHTSRCIDTLTPITADFMQTKNDVQIMAKALNEQECRKIFEEKADLLLNNFSLICPIKCSISNKRDHRIVLNPKNIAIKLVKNNELNRIMSSENQKKYNWGVKLLTVGSVIGCVIGAGLAYAGVFAIGAGISLFGGGGVVGWTCAIGGLGLICLGGYAALVPACTGIYEISQSQKCSTKEPNIKLKIPRILSIEPGCTKEIFVFVKLKDFKNTFTIKIKPVTKKSEAIVFDIELKTPDIINQPCLAK